MKTNKGLFIVFEGLDGSGQSTQIKMLADYLFEKGEQILTTKEPTKNSPFASKIREVLTEKQATSPNALQEFFAKDRKWHIKKVVEPALAKGEFVISDRYVFSSFAFGMANGLNFDEVAKMNENYLKPDLVFFIDTDPEVCVERIAKRGEGVDLFEKLPTLQKARENYLHILQNAKLLKVVFIDGNQSIADVFSQIKDALLRGLPLQ